MDENSNEPPILIKIGVKDEMFRFLDNIGLSHYLERFTGKRFFLSFI